jgi:hypothetical protein
METTTPANVRGNAAMAVRFRVLREQNLPRAAYRIEPRFWTSAGRQRAEVIPDWQRRACKNFEPRVTGIAWTLSRLYLVVATNTANQVHVAQLIHARALIRADPDYIEHQDKRVSMVLLAEKVEWPIADFARRHRVRIVVPNGVEGKKAMAPAEPTDTTTDTVAADDAGESGVER